MSVLRVMPGSPKYLTLVIVREASRLLLGMKKRGFGAGYYNGFGGKVEQGESIKQAAARELQEECGLEASEGAMDWRGVLTFNFDDNPQPWEVHVFQVERYSGVVRETEEMAPEWVALGDIPYERMWADDRHWYPLLLAGKRFRGTFDFTKTTTLVRHDLQELPQLEEGEEQGQPSCGQQYCEYIDLPLDFGSGGS